MKQLRLAPLAAALIPLACTSALAADATVSSAHDWSGVSLGLAGSISNGTNEWEDDGDFPLAESPFGGAFVGYDRQIDRFVLGGRATAHLGRMREVDYPTFEYRSFLDFNLRTGVAMERMLLYATGGYSVSNIEEDGENFSPTGYNIGAGVEYALTGDMIVGVEYAYRSLEAVCPHDMRFEQKISSVRAHVALKF